MRDGDLIVFLLQCDLLLVHGLDAVFRHLGGNQALDQQVSENALARNFKAALCGGALVEPPPQRFLRHQFLIDQLIQNQIIIVVAGAEFLTGGNQAAGDCLKLNVADVNWIAVYCDCSRRFDLQDRLFLDGAIARHRCRQDQRHEKYGMNPGKGLQKQHCKVSSRLRALH